MAFYISEECIDCFACVRQCPNQAIKEGETIHIIDPAKCTECVGSYDLSQCAEVCPVDACHPDPKHTETREQLLDKWRGLHPGETPKTT